MFNNNQPDPFTTVSNTIKTTAIVGSLGSLAFLALILGAILFGIHMLKSPTPAQPLPAPAVTASATSAAGLRST